MRKSKKSLMALAMAVTMTVTMAAGVMGAPKNDISTTTTETTTTAVENAKAKILKAVCTASGKVNVTFRGTVAYAEDVTAAIKDEDGKEWNAKIIKKTKSMAVVSATGLVKGKKYTVTVDGVKLKDAVEYNSVSRTFTAKKLKTTAKAKKVTKKVFVKAKNIIVVKLKGKVSYKEPVVKVTDEKGNVYEAKIAGKSKGNVKVSVKDLKKATKYTVTITGVKTKKEKNYASITTTFTTKK